jgi:hypothetical protein
MDCAQEKEMPDMDRYCQMKYFAHSGKTKSGTANGLPPYNI